MQEVATLAQLIADRSSAALIFDDARLAEENLNALGGMSNIHKGCIYLQDSILFAEHTKYNSRCEADLNNIVNSSTDKSSVANEGNWFSADSLHVVLPIQQGVNVLGHIYLVSDLTDVHLRMRQQISFSVFALIIVLLITALITGWIRKLIAGPVESLLAKYRGLFDYANDVIILSDASTGKILDANPAASRLYGYTGPELLTRSFMDLSSPATTQGAPILTNKVRSEGEAVFEREHCTKQGQIIPVEVSARLVNLDGKEAILSIIRNQTERKKVQRALAESETRFRALVEQSPISTQILSPDGRTILVNPAWEKFWGLRKEALDNYNILHDQQLVDQGIMPYIKMGFEGNAVEIPPIRYNPSDTPTLEKAPSIPDRWVRGFIFPINDSEGNLDEVMLTHEDVTEKKYTEEAIKNIAAGVSAKTGSEFFNQLVIYLSRLFNTKYSFIGLLDEVNKQQINTLAVCASGEIAENISYSLVDTPCAEVVGQQTCAHTRNVQTLYPKDKLLKEMDVESYIGTPLYNSEGQPLGLIVLLDDKPLERIELMREILQIFAARAGAELERINTEKQLSIKDRAMEVAIEGIILADAGKDNKIIYANHAMELITGYPRDELVEQNLRILQGPNTDSKAAAQLMKAMRNKESCKIEIINYRKDGKEFWNEITLTPVRNPEMDQVTHFIGTFVDVSERRNTEEALRRSQKMEAVGQLAGGIAHDFNNQLSIIIGYLGFLNEYLGDNKKQSQWVDTAMAATNRCIDLTRQLLVFSRRKIKETVATDINGELVKMDKLITKSLTPAINVENYLDERLWKVNIDPGEFQDAVLNLVINARDAMPDGGKLIIETSNKSLDKASVRHSPDLEVGDYVQIMVSDTGTGIGKNILDNIFDPFFTTKPEGKGTGLGLSMVYGFAHRYGGDVKVYSELGHGTTFRVYLPRAVQTSKDKPVKDKDNIELPRGSETILVVDDEQDLLELASRYLEDLGYTVIMANSGEVALDQFRQHPEVVALFSDVVMSGGMSGFELAEAIAELKPDIKVLLSSGFTEKAATQSQQRFITNLLHKPYRKAELAQRIRGILDNDRPESVDTESISMNIDDTNSDAPPFSGYRILVIDDDKDVRDLYEMNLNRLGLSTLCARNAEEAISLINHSIESNESINVVIVDLDLKGSLDGQKLAAKIHGIYPAAHLVVSSGDSGGNIMSNYTDYGFEAALEKNFNRQDIQQVLSNLLKTGS